MNYLSFFSGIGGFEVAIHNVFPNAKCLGFSEIDNHALYIYSKHFPDHKNIGDITKIKERDIKALNERCDLVVGGFPCQDLSRMNSLVGSGHGLEGKRSGLFFTFIKILKWIKKYNPHVKIIIENNSSMKNEYKVEITRALKTVFKDIIMNRINSVDFGLQKRDRLYWTNYKLDESLKPIRTQTWNDILLNDTDSSLFFNSDQIYTYNKVILKRSSEAMILKPLRFPYFKLVKSKTKGMSRVQEWFSSTSKNFSMPIRRSSMSIIVMIESQPEVYKVRRLLPIEIERLFFLPDGYVSNHISKTRAMLLLGNCVVTKVIEYILKCI